MVALILDKDGKILWRVAGGFDPNNYNIPELPSGWSYQIIDEEEEKRLFPLGEKSGGIPGTAFEELKKHKEKFEILIELLEAKLNLTKEEIKKEIENKFIERQLAKEGLGRGE